MLRRKRAPNLRCQPEKQWECITMAYVFETIPANRGLIDMNDPREVSWWRKRFDCSEQQLRQAVAQVGNSAAKVEQWLDGRKIVTL
jgi:hypothetical protein